MEIFHWIYRTVCAGIKAARRRWTTCRPEADPDGLLLRLIAEQVVVPVSRLERFLDDFESPLCEDCSWLMSELGHYAAHLLCEDCSRRMRTWVFLDREGAVREVVVP
jgi:hypothetical protein